MAGLLASSALSSQGKMAARSCTVGPMTRPRILSVNTARSRLLRIDDRDVATAIGKQPRDGAVAVEPLGLEGDEQADLSVHGGLSKAVYAYPVEHWPFWQTVRGQARAAAPDAPVRPGL